MSIDPYGPTYNLLRQRISEYVAEISRDYMWEMFPRLHPEAGIPVATPDQYYSRYPEVHLLVKDYYERWLHYFHSQAEEHLVLACRPETSSMTLTDIFHVAFSLTNNTAVQAAVASNPNIDVDLLYRITCYEHLQEAANENPVWPLLALIDPVLQGIGDLRLLQMYFLGNYPDCFPAVLQLRGIGPETWVYNAKDEQLTIKSPSALYELHVRAFSTGHSRIEGFAVANTRGQVVDRSLTPRPVCSPISVAASINYSGVIR